MRENLSLESPRSRDNFLRQPQIGAYFTKKASILQQHRMKFQIKGQDWRVCLAGFLSHAEAQRSLAV